MNIDIVKGHWHEIKGKLKQQWAKLTDDDLAQMQGNREELEGRIQKAYGYEKDTAKNEVNDFLTKHGFDKKDSED